MHPQPPERAPWPHMEILPLVDRVVGAALWVGRLLTKQVGHDPTDHFINDPLLSYPDHEGWVQPPDGTLT